MKYNLRCNRNISEKMTKKDFVYDIRPPIQSSRKLEEGKYPIVVPLQLRRKPNMDSKVPRYTVISEKDNYKNDNNVINYRSTEWGRSYKRLNSQRTDSLQLNLEADRCEWYLSKLKRFHKRSPSLFDRK
ncbi:uncharacterized protein LOC143427033 isoform X2 [Xylocopa sonorina]|uniref:uncharacterized protein LOC143427033 isoform X2 n=1 Tax=Xylocopa sonorina TaxID=1818115 RepID=UPI00403AA5B4